MECGPAGASGDQAGVFSSVSIPPLLSASVHLASCTLLQARANPGSSGSAVLLSGCKQRLWCKQPRRAGHDCQCPPLGAGKRWASEVACGAGAGGLRSPWEDAGGRPVPWALSCLRLPPCLGDLQSAGATGVNVPNRTAAGA